MVSYSDVASGRDNFLRTSSLEFTIQEIIKFEAAYIFYSVVKINFKDKNQLRGLVNRFIDILSF